MMKNSDKKVDKQVNTSRGTVLGQSSPAASSSTVFEATTSSGPAPAAASGRSPKKATGNVIEKTVKNVSGSSSSLIICRNKHWRYISAFHGPWLQMPIEILETIANINYNTPRPRPIDPAAFFDLVKIRRLVDEATNLAVRAASDIASPTLTNVNGGLPHPSSLYLPNPGGSLHGGGKLSRERKFRMREQASQKLARAYRLDEIACSVATMQGASPLDKIGSYVLQRGGTVVVDQDAQYVHFFHEKIPSRQLAESTSLQPLTDIINHGAGRDPEVLRTRAAVKVFKEDFEGAAQDLTSALSLCRFHRPLTSMSVTTGSAATPSAAITPGQQKGVHDDSTNRPRRRPVDVILAEKDQPSSLQGQLLFQRATVYLTMACNLVAESLPQEGTDYSQVPFPEEPAAADVDTATSDKVMEARKSVKTLAKRALRDYMAFISQFEYSPNLPIRAVTEFSERTTNAAQGTRSTRPSSVITSNTIYPLSSLFAATPPSDLPPYPIAKADHENYQPRFHDPNTCEWSSYHPLLSDALHSLLLSHCLAQTSTKEIQRHAYMVARIVRLSDGFPILQASRSPARADWIEALRRTDNWLQLSSTWESLCAPAPLPGSGLAFNKSSSSNMASSSALAAACSSAAAAAAAAAASVAPDPLLAASAAEALINGISVDTVKEEIRRVATREQAILESLDDERITDEISLRASILAREAQIKNEQQAHPPPPPALSSSSSVTTVSRPSSSATTHRSDCNCTNRHQQCSSSKRGGRCHGGGGDDSREFLLISKRATAIAQWVKEAPVVTGTTRRKRRSKKEGTSGGSRMSRGDVGDVNE